ncbi:Hypothetical protein NTJ_12475 [Nesidiocoris tenuis]|uniref:Uncharacterized protein n=1 Tax=Nesidiocoris tenuis TaxID=355587 RepID=A0ABN7B5H4_9HEMI|nr:Hypothetical protein NTJ_12475 [Nesidiocoris tenuis]
MRFQPLETGDGSLYKSLPQPIPPPRSSSYPPPSILFSIASQSSETTVRFAQSSSANLDELLAPPPQICRSTGELSAAGFRI